MVLMVGPSAMAWGETKGPIEVQEVHVSCLRAADMKWVSRLREGKKGPSQPLSPTHVSSDSDLEQHFKELWEHFRAVESDKGKNPNAFGEVLAAFCSLLRANDTGSDVLDL
ncbi:Beige/BEACH and WD40 domain-containing protein [Klebsormidium nitens]|uniref:Beige/BEACH and WD40 domain-containing protein n=1 Tax=Klebsormidium nitens TaxID=105231 RepID=A0A0U9HRP5_KLENI|nr:Beige/BEACH and WD40 domain-containing protein [Klebsormidium nitens]|eukprot:GAQ83264.1 Beige/BEACH and WD40 domain-containing protein [Klebsormidium nitens]